MSFAIVLQNILESQEHSTVGDAFGGPATSGKAKSYSVASIRDWILAQRPFSSNSTTESSLKRADSIMSEKLLTITIGNLIRFSFLIELTNLKVGSTKMKTRWLPGKILMPQPNSFEPIQGVFEPNNDQRSSSFDNCLQIFNKTLDITSGLIDNDPTFESTLIDIDKYNSVPYEFIFDYIDQDSSYVHSADNVYMAANLDLKWLLRARKILNSRLNQQEKNKIQTKTYKTDRALTGKDKTNRAKRWEILSGDFQHASLTNCWSVEKKLLSDLVCFENFPNDLKAAFIDQGLINQNSPTTRCPVTLAYIDYNKLIEAATHGVSAYQIGHLHPLKRGGKHKGDNVCWQSSDGNRIQGDLTIEETYGLLSQIADRRMELGL